MVSSTLRPHFILGKNPVAILQEAGWAPGPVWTGGKSRPHRDFILYNSRIYCLMILHSNLHPFQPSMIKRTGLICTAFLSSPFVILHHSPPGAVETFSFLLILCCCYILLRCIVCCGVLSLLLGPCDKDVLIRSPDRPDPSESLYRLRYPGPRV